MTEQQRTETLLDLFEHEGWKIVISELTELNEHLRNYADIDCVTNDLWQYRRGTLQAQASFLSFENTTKIIAEQALEGDIDDLQDV